MFYRLGIFLFIIVISCSGEDVINKDTIPPIKPYMVPHLGDTGDYIGGEAQNYYVNNEFEFNGIDAVSGEDWIKIQWEHISDDDADYLEVYRFNMSDYNYYLENIESLDEDYDFSTRIQILETTENDHYVDHSGNLLGDSWFYFINVFDLAGNSTKSDTVCYRLIDRPAILYPLSGNINYNELVFGWDLDSELSASQSRLLLFDENRQLLWVYSPLDFDDTVIVYFGEYLDPQTLIWRVDTFADDQYYNVMGKVYRVFAGAESIENILYLDFN